jgi:hypothetical protein
LLTGRDADWATWLRLAAVLAAAPAVLDTVSVVAAAAVDVVVLDAGALDADVVDAGVVDAEVVAGAEVGETPDGPVLPAAA